MTVYVDSSALVPVYVPERFSQAARRALRGSPQVPFTLLHQLEVPNAFASLVGRGLISDDEYRAIRTQLQQDIDAQRLVPLALDWDHVFEGACELSESYTAKLLARSLDLSSRGCGTRRTLPRVRVRGRSSARGRQGDWLEGRRHQARRSGSTALSQQHAYC